MPRDGACKRKFNWQGELVRGYSTMARINQPAGTPRDGGEHEYLLASTQVWAWAENYGMNRARLGGMRANPRAPFVRRAPVDDDTMDPQALARYRRGAHALRKLSA